MIKAERYITVVKTYFDFLIKEFAYKLSNETIKGNVFYDIKYTNDMNVVSISYENIEDYLLVIIFILQDGVLPDYDDKTKTLHLNTLTGEVFKKIDKRAIALNNEYFVQFNAEDELERKLLKSAKDLRLCINALYD